MTAYDPRDWFWIVGDDVTRAWSSAAGGYVSVWDQSRTTRIASEEELSEVLRPYGLDVPVVTRFDVNAERDRRMVTMVFAGKAYDLRDQSLSNVSSAGMLALAAIISGAAPGHLRWADPGEDFTWIANALGRTSRGLRTTTRQRRWTLKPVGLSLRQPPHGASTAFSGHVR